jgi:hypothetical protein
VADTVQVPELAGRRRAPAYPRLLRGAAITALAFTWPIATALRQKGFFFDDPFILARYGQHLADGAGWNFNLGSHTDNAVTSGLYVLLIAAGAFMGFSPEGWSLCIYVAAWGLGAIVLARILFRDGRRVSGWLACGLYSIAPLLANARGMELSVYLLLILASIWAFQRDRWLLLGILLGLLTVARADAVLLAAPLIVWLGFRRPQALPKVLMPFAAINVAWLAAVWMMTGSVIPSTLAAKIAQRDSGQWGPQSGYLGGLASVAITGWEQFATGFLAVVCSAVVVAAAAATVITVRRREQVVPILAAAAVINVIEFGVVFRLIGYVWHYGPWTLWVIAGTAVALEEVGRRFHHAAAAVGVAVIAAAFLPAVHLAPDKYRDHYREAAEWINRDSHQPHPTVAVNEIGTIGYYSRADIVDYLGLLDLKAIDSVRRNDFTWWLGKHPDYFVIAPGLALEKFDGRTTTLPQFQREYKPAARFGELVIYRRVQVPQRITNDSP